MLKTSPSFDQIIKDLKNKIYHPIYFLSGEEPYYIDKISDYIINNTLKEEEKAFNQTISYGKETSAAQISNSAKRFPMMSNYQVVVVKEAQEVKDFDDLIYYFSSPLKSTILVINYKYKKLDKRKKTYKALKENAVFLETKKLYDDKIPDWISKSLQKKGYSIDTKAGMLLTEFLGNDLLKIENELDKLIITLPQGIKTISPDHVERNIGISKDYNNFELQKALIERKPLKANRIINYFASNQKKHHISQTITFLYFFYSKVLMYHVLKDKSQRNVAANLKIHPFFVNDYAQAARSYPAGKVVRIISILREYDMKSKGYGSISTDTSGLLKELIYKILH